jgi:hypothetical protein
MIVSTQGGGGMSFTYFPILRWKQGEVSAMRRLASSDRSSMLPLAEVQALEPGTAQLKLRKALDWAGAASMPVAIDLRHAYARRVPLTALARLTAALQASGLIAWPVIHESDALLDPGNLSSFKGQPAVVLRINPSETLVANAVGLVSAFRTAMGRRADIYVVLDLGSIGEIDSRALAAMIEPFVAGVLATNYVTQVAVAGGSFPYSLGGLKVGVSNRLPRRELEVWKSLRARPSCSELAFGDYGVTNPAPLEELDPRTINPSAAIRYTLKNEWWVLRASGVRSRGKGGMGQYNDLCRLLVSSSDYSGSAFSYGDNQYQVHSQPGASSGSFMTWRRDATSHHLVYTVRQLIAGYV